MWIGISWLLQKPADLDLHCFQMITYQGSVGKRLSKCSHSHENPMQNKTITKTLILISNSHTRRSTHDTICLRNHQAMFRRLVDARTSASVRLGPRLVRLTVHFLQFRLILISPNYNLGIKSNNLEEPSYEHCPTTRTCEVLCQCASQCLTGEPRISESRWIQRPCMYC